MIYKGLKSSDMPSLPLAAKELIVSGVYSLYLTKNNEYLLVTNKKESYVIDKNGVLISTNYNAIDYSKLPCFCNFVDVSLPNSIQL